MDNKRQPASSDANKDERRQNRRHERQTSQVSGDANKDERRQNRRHERQTSQVSGDAIHRLWMTRKEALGHLQVSARTLERMVKRGEVTRQRMGRQSRYRIVNWRQQAKSGGINRRQASKNVAPVTPVSDANDANSTQALTPDISKLIALVDRLEREKTEAVTLGQKLAEKLMIVESQRDSALFIAREGCKERDEAVQLGHQLADERDQIANERDRMSILLGEAHDTIVRSNVDVRRLHDALESLSDAIATVCGSPLSAPVRRRLRAALATC